MAATVTKSGWRGLVNRLTSQAAKSVADYSDLVERLASGEEIADTQVEAALHKAGKSPFDLSSDVASKIERLRLAKEIERLEALAREGDEADGEIRKLVAAHDEAVAKLVREVNAKMEQLRLKVAAAAPASGQINDLRGKLLATADERMKEQQAHILADLREAVEVARRAHEILQDEIILRGVSRDDQQVHDLRVRAEQADERVKQVQQQAADIQVEMMRP